MTWESAQELILYRLDEMKKQIEELKEKTEETHRQLQELRAKASVWGVVAGFITTVITELGFYFLGKHK